jgi:hypothetical protein
MDLQGLLCGPLRISALKWPLNAETAEITQRTAEV